jgi:serine/threonine-protein kinase
MTNRFTGTPLYASPESSYGQIRPESDLYAAGIIAYQMLTGALPFGPETGVDHRMERRYVPLTTAVPGLDPKVQSLIDEVLEPDPERRLRSAKVLAERLAAA